MDERSLVSIYLTALGIGLLMGLERERAKADGPGLRSFALVALAGATAAIVAQAGQSAWVLGTTLIAIAGLAVADTLRGPRNGDGPGATTNAALLLCFLLAALCAYDEREIAVAAGVAATALLYFRPELHGFSERLSTLEMRAIVQFAAVAFVLLPLLPDRTWDPWDAINPFRIGLLVVLISGLSLAGYAALKLFDHRHAVLAMGLLGGAVSSTATTLTFSRRAREGAVPAPAAALIVSLANLTMLLRIGAIAVAASPALLPTLAPVLGTALVIGLALPLRMWLRLRSENAKPELEMKNPADLRSAFLFVLVFTVVLAITAVANDMLGTAGLYAVAGLSGLTQVDAISLSTMQMSDQGRIEAATAVIAIAIACAANLAFKAGVVATIGGREMLRGIVAPFGLQLAGLITGVLLWR
ncbi:MAG: MgtC/SapB family protein [Sinimarinibacterium flocculans]|uniref:MgtC/SapB family protein n=1 Tax=Sinimarinibacterium flocculans TaxID=985250 RepID=UPI003C32E0BC